MLQNIVTIFKALFNIQFDLVFLRLGENFKNSLQPQIECTVQLLQSTAFKYRVVSIL